MKRRKNKRRNSFNPRVSWQAPLPRTIEMEPEALAAYVRHAEQLVLPIIKELKPSPGAAQILLAQCTQMLATWTTESALVLSNAVLELWEAGIYTPSPEYPFTFEETVQELEEGPRAKGDYADAFQPFTPVEAVPPRGVGQVAGGIVQHPETKLWQIWMIGKGPYAYFGAYQDAATAQSVLEVLIHTTRRGSTLTEDLYHRLLSHGVGQPKNIPFDMMLYLNDHLHHYEIKL